ncbi:MAG: aminotransferase class I/II-fold pyridoxal phosphate-dependent enzyme [Candidatus Margulisbacteria bacterium]|nr:aminotransferase class I/II-fold pyridoxal phosphate-dependent enzyme [Candidatus Margulisiibacteriota bacterium]
MNLYSGRKYIVPSFGFWLVKKPANSENISESSRLKHKLKSSVAIQEKKSKVQQVLQTIVSPKKIDANTSFRIKEKSISLSKSELFLNTVDDIWNEAHQEDILHLVCENKKFNGKKLIVNGKKLLNFGSCGYFGLEFDERLRKSAIEGISKYGTQFAFPPIYMSTPDYRELKSKYHQIFGVSPLIAQTTTLAHLGCIPIIVGDKDIVLLDQQVHNSVQMAIKIIVARGVIVKTVPHSNLEVLEEKIKKLKGHHKKIWYFIDGIYSMYGDFAPIKELQELQKKYPQLSLYIDDAHGMSWLGKHGSGYALSQLETLDNVILATSHAKCFGSSGGTLIINDKPLAEKVRKFGSTMIFSGPLQPSLVGACIASADIHLSGEIYLLQDKLKEKIKYRSSCFEVAGLPVVDGGMTPISFIGIGDHRAVGDIVKILMEEGFYVNPALFPAVSKTRNGIRITTTLHQTKRNIQLLADVLAYYLPKVLSKYKTSLEEVFQKYSLIR